MPEGNKRNLHYFEAWRRIKHIHRMITMQESEQAAYRGLDY